MIQQRTNYVSCNNEQIVHMILLNQIIEIVHILSDFPIQTKIMSV